MSPALNSIMPQTGTDTFQFSTSGIMPEQGIWIGWVWLPDRLAYRKISGPHAVMLSKGGIFDLSDEFGTTSELINKPDPVAELKKAAGKRSVRCQKS